MYQISDTMFSDMTDSFAASKILKEQTRWQPIVTAFTVKYKCGDMQSRTNRCLELQMDSPTVRIRGDESTSMALTKAYLNHLCRKHFHHTVPLLLDHCYSRF